MDLYSGLPYWIAKNPLENYFNPLHSDITTEVVIIGTGITGAFIAHELCKAGISCVMVDKQGVSSGSSIASTAMLKYELETPLCELSEKIGEKQAAMIYTSCLKAIDDVEAVFKSIGHDLDFERVPSVYYASNRKGFHLLEKEYACRKRHNLPVTFLEKRKLEEKYGIRAHGAIENHTSAQMDPYAGSTHLIRYQMERYGMQVYTHTRVDRCEESSSGYLLVTDRNNIIQCKYVAVAAGFEADRFLPQKVIRPTSTYAIVSQPVESQYMWPENSLIWETEHPDLFVRTTNNRIIVGGEDVEFKDPVLRDKLLRRKVGKLESKFKRLFPEIPFVTEMAWCGTFTSTEDKLPFIGTWPGKDAMFYGFGYGSSGLTYSMIAAQMWRNKLLGVKDERESVLGFDRLKPPLKK